MLLLSPLLPLLLLPAVLTLPSPGPHQGCGQCQPALCPPPPEGGCAQGTMLDPCGCCQLCAPGEDEPCGPAGACGAGTECLKLRKRRKGPAAPGLCVCKNRHPVCGSDGVTYPSGCRLQAASAAALRRGEEAVSQRAKGECQQAPSIVTPPKQTWNISGAQVYLSCEVIGIPTPILTWNKVIRTNYGVQKMELLPGDRDNLAIQTRGGPEKHEVTGWVLISPLTKDDAGEYECHAQNSRGEAAASAKIVVVSHLQQIPLKPDQDAEL
ncbi:insulin-like growth factor-binding protein 7 [Lissotriton helveticus]